MGPKPYELLPYTIKIAGCPKICINRNTLEVKVGDVLMQFTALEMLDFVSLAEAAEKGQSVYYGPISGAEASCARQRIRRLRNRLRKLGAPLEIASRGDAHYELVPSC